MTDRAEIDDAELERLEWEWELHRNLPYTTALQCDAA